jgi:hypothetical protein
MRATPKPYEPALRLRDLFYRIVHMPSTFFRTFRHEGRRLASCGTLLLALTAAPSMSAQGVVPAVVRGIAFTIDSGLGVPEPPEVVRRFGASPMIVTQLAGRIVFAGGRGRLDVSGVARHPVVRIAGVVLAAPLATPGDYYLFDSTGFVLVRPVSRTFSSFHIADDHYNYEGHREGWPAFFPFKRPSLDSLGPAAPPDLLRQHGAYPVYWHADIPGRQLARGRFTLVDARPGELAAVRWFAATRALAGLLLRGDTLSRRMPTLTALGLWREASDTVPPTAVIEMRPFGNPRPVDVRAELLRLPAGYTEAPWPGYEKAQQVFPTSADSGAYWRRFPQR